ncbi:hypothetical protein, partial [Actinocorallia lasiicapitis]
RASLPEPVADRVAELVAGAAPGPDVLDRAVGELLADRMLSDAVWAELPLTDQEKLALCLLTGDEAMIAMTLRSGLRVEDR